MTRPPRRKPRKSRPAKLRYRARSHYAVYHPLGTLQRSPDGTLLLEVQFRHYLTLQASPRVALPELPCRVQASLRVETKRNGRAAWRLLACQQTPKSLGRRSVYLCGDVLKKTPGTLTLRLTRGEQVGQYPEVVTVRLAEREAQQLRRVPTGETVIINAHPAWEEDGTYLDAHHVIPIPE